ncbi:hypothetical protein [Algicella marina]|uniref:Uncharacterized protein n=1 Tax=Algicella marina TaxID=2683284 RepID=A0A6P1T1B3_9RHOB|nr:hypothetical protein [Algicella marina]QHQ35777.1 hypothetical protein GO499_11630 [Algicella marina]
MDILVLTWYGLICGILSILSPNIRRMPFRFITGVAVGVVSALVLPLILAQFSA